MLTFLDSEDLREDTTWTILKMNGKQKEKDPWGKITSHYFCPGKYDSL